MQADASSQQLVHQAEAAVDAAASTDIIRNKSQGMAILRGLDVSVKNSLSTD